MFENYLKVAVRNLLRQKGYSLINVTGLAVGMACCLLIAIFVRNEWSYDTFHEKGDRIYRVALNRLYPNHTGKFAITQAPIAPTLVRDFPEVVEGTRIFNIVGTTQISYKDQQFDESRYLFADSNFFDVFSFRLLKGNPKKALATPNTVLMTEETARKYFGDEEPMGKIVRHGDNDLTVAGVIETPRENSHIVFDLIEPMVTIGVARSDDWIGFVVHNYIVLHPEASAKDLEAKLPQMAEKYIAPQIEKRLNMTYEQYTEAGNGYDFFLQPIKDVHLHSNLEFEITTNGNATYVTAFAFIAVIILAIACINFMNLATARAAGRAKEVGVRKVLGSHRRQLMRQFLLESVLLAVLAFVIAVGLVQIALPWVNQLIGQALPSDLFGNPALLVLLVGVAVVVGLLAGSYPAIFLSGFQPIAVLKGELQTGTRGVILRNGLVVLQFTISIMLIVGTFVVYRQVDFMQSKRLGFDTEQVVVVENAFRLQDKREAFQQALRSSPDVLLASGANAMPGEAVGGVMFQPKGAGSENMTGRAMVIDHDYLETMGMRLLEGRSFAREFPTDTLAAIINEAAARDFGFENPIGQQIVRADDGRVYTIVGVVENFHFQSLHHSISALVMLKTGSAAGHFVGFIPIRFKAGKTEEILAFLESTWREFAPDSPLKYSFLDEKFAAFYTAEKQTGRIFAVFTGLAIFVACLGLFGLAAFMAQKRTREIGIRKVLGATVANVSALLSKDFVKLVLVANLIALPAAWFAMSQWLQGFAYRAEIGWWIFALAGGLALVIALLTVSSQAVQAALANPVDSLRYE